MFKQFSKLKTFIFLFSLGQIISSTTYALSIPESLVSSFQNVMANSTTTTSCGPFHLKINQPDGSASIYEEIIVKENSISEETLRVTNIKGENKTVTLLDMYQEIKDVRLSPNGKYVIIAHKYGENWSSIENVLSGENGNSLSVSEFAQSVLSKQCL